MLIIKKYSRSLLWPVGGGGKLSGAFCAEEIKNRKNDIYVLCSDGLCGILKKEKMMEYNVTAILVQCE